MNINTLLEYIAENKGEKKDYLFFKCMIESTIDTLKNTPPDILISLDDLVKIGLNPSIVGNILEELGYEQTDLDTNGWQGDTWVTYEKEDSFSIVMFYEGWDFSLALYKKERGKW